MKRFKVGLGILFSVSFIVLGYFFVLPNNLQFLHFSKPDLIKKIRLPYYSGPDLITVYVNSRLYIPRLYVNDQEIYLDKPAYASINNVSGFLEFVRKQNLNFHLHPGTNIIKVTFKKSPVFSKYVNNSVDNSEAPQWNFFVLRSKQGATQINDFMSVDKVKKTIKKSSGKIKILKTGHFDFSKNKKSQDVFTQLYSLEVNKKEGWKFYSMHINNCSFENGQPVKRSLSLEKSNIDMHGISGILYLNGFKIENVRGNSADLYNQDLTKTLHNGINTVEFKINKLDNSPEQFMFYLKCETGDDFRNTMPELENYKYDLGDSMGARDLPVIQAIIKKPGNFKWKFIFHQ